MVVPVKTKIRKTTAKRIPVKKDETDDEEEQVNNAGDTFDLEVENNVGNLLMIVPEEARNGKVDEPPMPTKAKPSRVSRAKQPAKVAPKPKTAPARKAPARGKKIEEKKEEVDANNREEAMEEDDCNKAESEKIIVPEKIDFTSLKLEKIINESTTSKMITFQGTYDNKTAVIQLEKTSIDEAAIKKTLGDKKTTTKLDFSNDIYSSYMIGPTISSNTLTEIKATVICPANESVLTKYARSEAIFVSETVDTYSRVVEPFIANKLASDENCNNWVYNILDGKSEVDRIIMNDPDSDSGFVLTSDLKWAGDENDLHLLAICHRRDIRSLRDLDDRHMILLKNILTKGTKAIKDSFKKSKGQLRAFIHYQPSFYHFHVHFRMVEPSDYRSTDRDHLLSTVINNITLNKDYYKKATLNYPLSVSSALYQDLKKAKRS